MKLYQEEERPQDAIGYIRQQLGGEFSESEELKLLKAQIAKLEADKESTIVVETIENIPTKTDEIETPLEIETVESEEKPSEEKPSEEPTESVVESLLDQKFKALGADDTGSSLLKEYLTEEIFENLKELKTDLNGSLSDNIQSGLTHFDSEVGVFASDQHAYETFKTLFDPVLEDLHDAEGEAAEGEDPVPVTQPELDWGDAEELAELDPEGLFIKSVSITVGRAVNSIAFMPTVSLDDLKETAENLRKTLEAVTDEDLKGKYHELSEIDAEQKTKWIEDGTLFGEPENKFLKAAETYRFWPMGRGVFINDKETFRVWINEEEHLQVTAFDNTSSNLKAVYERLVKVMELFNDVKFARNKRWGFVAHNLKNVGNTMRIRVKAKIPQLSLPENTDKLETLAEGNNFTTNNLDNGIFEITNSKRHGASEIDTTKAFVKGVKEIITAEKCLYVE